MDDLLINNRLYETVDGYGRDFTCFDINGLRIPISNDWQEIAVNVSGGADSACLAMLLCEHIAAHGLDIKVNVISFLRNWETRPWQGPIAQNIYDAFKARYPDIINRRYELYMPPELEMGTCGIILDGRSGDQIIGGSFNRYLGVNQGMDAIYNATSQNPDMDPPHPQRLTTRDGRARDATGGSVMFRFTEQGSWMCHPFKFVQKDWIMAQYRLLAADWLLSLTRSCEGDMRWEFSDIPDMATRPLQALPLCNNCFWCAERSWAELRCDEVISELSDSALITHDHRQ